MGTGFNCLSCQEDLNLSLNTPDHLDVRDTGKLTKKKKKRKRRTKEKKGTTKRKRGSRGGRGGWRGRKKNGETDTFLFVAVAFPSQFNLSRRERKSIYDDNPRGSNESSGVPLPWERNSAGECR